MNDNNKPFLDISLNDKLILGGISSVIFPFLVVCLIIEIQLSDSLLEVSEDKAMHMAWDIADSVDTALAWEIKMVSAIAADPDIIKGMSSEDYGAVQKHLKATNKSIGEKNFTFFITDKKGITIGDASFDNNIELNLSDRDYFIKAKQGHASVSGPLRSRGKGSSGDPIVVVCAPIMDEGRFYGAVGMPFSIDFFVNMLSHHKIGRTGYGFLIDDEGMVLAHPNKEFILNLALFNHPNTKEIQAIVVGKDNGLAAYRFEGTNKIAGLHRLETIDWTAVFTQNKTEIMSPLNEIINSILICGLFFLIITVTIIIILSRQVSTPIEKMIETIKLITQHSSEVILHIGPDRKIGFANPAFEKITGLNADTVVGTEPRLDNPNQTPPEAIWHIIESGEPWSGRLTLKREQTGLVTLSVMFLPLRDNDGTLNGYVLIGKDISAEVLHEARLKQSQKLEAIGTLAGGIAHDFNNILSAIFGYADLALMTNDSVAENEKYIQQIKIASERARDLVSQILTFSRKTDVELRPLMPETVLKEAVKLLRASITANIDIQIKMGSHSMIMAEPTQLHQVVMNLFTNAAHAIGGKSGRISLYLEDFFVDKAFTQTHPNINEGKHVRIRIVDTGGGIEPKALEQIFEPFFTTKPQGHGTGLGLSVVHGIVKKMQGIITVYSTIGEGTAFNILIPSLQADNDDGQEQEVSLQGGTENIMIIDDEESIAFTLQAILNNLGYHVTYCTDSLKALATIEQNPDDLDIIITDNSMPKLSGLELAEKLKAAGIQIPIILTTGFLEKTIEERARQVGVTELVVKPVNCYQLSGAIRKIIGGKTRTNPSPT